MDDSEKNVRQQFFPSNTGKTYKTDEDRSLNVRPLQMWVSEFFINTEFSSNYELSRAKCDPLENLDPEIAATD